MFWTQMVVIVSRLGFSPDVPVGLEQVTEARAHVGHAVASAAHGDGDAAASPWTTDAVSEALRGVAFVGHMHQVADVPVDVAWFVYRASLSEGLDPKDLAAVLISEESGPDIDFSYEGSAHRDYDMDYEADDVGRAGELGLFQVHPRWAKKAGYREEALYDPRASASIAAYVVRSAQERHASECETRRYNYHAWIAHYKCSPSERDDIDGYCRFKQKKWEKLRASLDAKETPDFSAIGRDHDRWVRKVQSRALRDWKRRQRRRARQLKRQLDRALPEAT